MKIPYVIDNRTVCPADVLNYLLAGQANQAMDIATAYFGVRRYEQVAGGLDGLRSLACCWAPSRRRAPTWGHSRCGSASCTSYAAIWTRTVQGRDAAPREAPGCLPSQ